MSSNSKPSLASKIQTVCIDLPGETVQCWRSTDKVQVILKKHRDVIFHLRLSCEKIYTVESTGSDFYHAQKKKLIAGRNRQRVMFSDGERLHLWVARDFKGEILLKSAGELMMKIDPRKLDEKHYDVVPTTKPDPIIISIGNSSQISKSKEIGNGPHPTRKLGNFSEHPTPMAAPVDEECPVVCVVDGDLQGVPADVWKFLGAGGDKSGLSELDPNNIATRNWILGQLAGASAYIGDNWKWLAASIDGKTHAGFKLVKAKIHHVKGKARFYFSGYSKRNAVFGPGGFGPGHERIMNVFSGTGKISTSLVATAKGVLGTFKGNALISFIFGSVSAIAEWKTDIAKDGYDLAAALTMAVVKSILAAALTTIIVTCIVAFIMFVVGASVSILAVGALTIGAGIVAGYAMDAMDKKFGKVIGGDLSKGGLADMLADHMRKSVEYNWSYLKKNLLWDYEEMPF